MKKATGLSKDLKTLNKDHKIMQDHGKCHLQCVCENSSGISVRGRIVETTYERRDKEKKSRVEINNREKLSQVEDVHPAAL